MSRIDTVMSTHNIADIDFVLRRVFGKLKFRPYQREIICAVLQGDDVFVQAATSFGKSLCYQLPAVIDHGITICVSPLLSLMRDQVLQLRSSGVEVATVNGTTLPGERDTIMEDLRFGHPRLRLLYVTPEFCMSESFRGHLRTVYNNGELARIAIDEAHCISEWGHDFRSSYLHLSFFRASFPNTPIICLTATATASVRHDVISTLSLHHVKLKVFTTTPSRPNLHYEVQFFSEQNDYRLKGFVLWLRNVQNRRVANLARKSELDNGGERIDSISGIIYTSTRDSCDELAKCLRTEGIGAVAYHAGLSQQDRIDCQTKWLKNVPGYDVIVATTAFGMGIDKDDVRFVLHWNLPKSFEGFYQEAGRAGRDGKASLCTMFYSREDRQKIEYRVRESHDRQNKAKAYRGDNTQRGLGMSANRLSSFDRLVEYCESVEQCRHRMISAYFEEDVGLLSCDFACDFCKDKRDLARRKEVAFTRVNADEMAY